MSSRRKIPIISFISLLNSIEKVIISLNVAKGFCNQGYATLFIDLDFDSPIIATSLRSNGILARTEDDYISSNEWIFNPDIEFSEILKRSYKVSSGNDENPELSLTYASLLLENIRNWQSMNNVDIEKSFKRVNKFVRFIRKENKFDMVILNLPNNIDKSAIPIINSTNCFAITGHDKVTNSLLKVYHEAMNSIHPLLKISGIIVDSFRFEYPDKDSEEASKLEDASQLPVVAMLPAVRSRQYIDEEVIINWDRIDPPAVRNLSSKLCTQIENFIENPRTVKKKSKIRIYSLFVLSRSGLPIFTNDFLPRQEIDDVLTSAGLTSLISGVALMIGEIVNKQGSAKLIELQKVKLIIEEWHENRFIILSSAYDESLRENLKLFARKFSNKYKAEIDELVNLGGTSEFEGIGLLINNHFKND